jgi:NAD(P)-dependent dehydrogenase (short-subunit alcohol dehydrogenase family)
MENKTALISGGTSGIGLSLVEHLILSQYNVYFIGTDTLKGKAIEQRLGQKTEKKVEFIQLDLSNLNAVHSFAKEFIRTHRQLDLLVNIAGVLLPKRIVTDEGIEMNFAISCLSSFILSRELLPLLQKSSQPRIVNVGAKPDLVLKESLDFNDLDTVNKYNAFKASGRAVHAKTVLTQILSEEFAEYTIAVNSFDPGIVKTGLMKKMPVIIRLISSLFFAFAPKKSKTGIFVCTNEEENNITGKLVTATKIHDISFSKNYQTKVLGAIESLISRVIKSRKPNYKIDWIVPNKLAGLTHFHSEVTQEDIQGVSIATEKLLESVDEEFSLIIDNRLMSMANLYTLEQLQSHSPFLSHRYLKYVIVIIPNNLEVSDVDCEIQQSKGVRLKNVSKVSEAYKFLYKSGFIPKDGYIDHDFLGD